MDLGPNAESATREVFLNIAPWMRVVFYGLMLASVSVLGFQVWRRARLWSQGQPGGFEKDWRLWARRLFVFALAQKRVYRKSLGAVLHVLLFSGFVVLTIGTTLLAIADKGPVNFHHGWYYLFYELSMDVFGVALCAGCCLGIWRRLFQRPSALGHSNRDWILLSTLLALGITGFLVEAFRLHYTQVAPEIARWSPVGQVINLTLLHGLDLVAAQRLHLGFWWLHAILIALFFASLPVTRFMHVLTGPANIAARPARPMGVLKALKIEEVEKTGKVGVSAVGDFTRQQLLSLDACMECGRCEEACPATASGKPLSPKNVVLNLRDAMAAATSAGSLHDTVISAETLWACTTCQACVQECPVLIGQVDLISDLRRNLVGEGHISGPPAKAMAGISRQSNPYGRPASERMAWATGLDVPTVDTNPNFEYLLWLGCAVSYDPRAQKVARALAQLLQEANVNFAVLGDKERCTGDPARRMGDEFLFQELAQANIETLGSRQVKKIVTPCPHCMNSLQNEYAEFGGHYQVQHHTQLLADLVNSGRLAGRTKAGEKVTYHDPCYLARANRETKAPRAVLKAATGCSVSEMPRHGTKTFCCGAGGGRMWFDEAPAQRVSKLRASEAAETGAQTLATGCPFCLNMMSDAMNAAPENQKMKVLDIAEVLLESRSADRANT
ncbi:MAG TPA: heterodisulfide reductase-related iron-sulfur binding cluster [Candidatus Didemnitutus sp.]|nr:heterodisulfide reductase-related iron-sulfur binding cluster [Candidatus Didemnitutus sp.]